MIRALRSLQHRNFRLFAGGQVISLIGTWMQSVAQSWLVYKLTHSAILLGTVAFLSQIPVLFITPVAGVVADRSHRWRLVVTTQVLFMLAAFTLAALVLTHRVQLWHVLALAAFTGAVNAVDIPSRQSFLVEMVGREDLMNAIALNSSMFNGARIVGPAVAGLVVAAVGEGWCFLLNGISYLAVIGGLLLMRLKPPGPRADSAGMLAGMREGVAFVRRHEALRWPMLLLGAVSFSAMSYMVLMPIFADHILKGGARGLGLLMSAAGLGALGAALMLARRETVRGLGATMGWAPVGFGLALAVFAASRNLWLSAAALVPAGFSVMSQMTSTNTLIQSMVPDGIRGRVMSLYTVMLLGVAPFGNFLMGAVAQRFGAPVAVFGAAVCTVACGLTFLRRLERFRASARPLLAAQGHLPSAVITVAEAADGH